MNPRGGSVVTSRHGVFSIAFAVGALFFGAVSAYYLYSDWIINRIDIPAVPTFGAILGLTTFWYIPSVLSSKYEITPEQITIKTFSDTKTILWQEISAIHLSPTFFGPYQVALQRPGRWRNIVLHTALFANPHELAKAVIEAATAVNKDVVVKGINPYGPPPYQVFQDGKVETNH